MILTGKLLQVYFPRPESGLLCWVVQVAHCSEVPEGAGRSCGGCSPGIQVCPGAGNFSVLYKDTGGASRALPELSEEESEVRGAP